MKKPFFVPNKAKENDIIVVMFGNHPRHTVSNPVDSNEMDQNSFSLSY